jgi:hypothetical protein
MLKKLNFSKERKKKKADQIEEMMNENGHERLEVKNEYLNLLGFYLTAKYSCLE